MEELKVEEEEEKEEEREHLKEGLEEKEKRVTRVRHTSREHTSLFI